MDTGHHEFFAIVGEGAALLKNLDEGSAGFFDDLNRLREILAMLGYVPAGKPLQFSLSDREASIAALWDYLGAGMSVLPDELAVYEAETVAALAEVAGDRSLSRAAQEWAIDNGRKPQGHLISTKLAAFHSIAARGVKHGIEQAALLQAIQDAQALLEARPEESPEYAEAQATYSRISLERRQAFDALNAMILQFGLDGGDTADLKKKRDDLYASSGDEQTAAWQRLNELHTKFNEDRLKTHRELFEANGTAIIAKVAEGSPITHEQAQAWASDQIIDANAKAKLKRLGYSHDDVIRDMAEFYRLTGGKASAIRIGIDGGQRANAVGVTSRLGEKVINLGARFNKTVLFHELAHHLENDPIAKAAANGFLMKRREGEDEHPLRDLTGNRGYGKGEVAYKDHFMDAYVGKVYNGGITEVFSMGVQYLANPKDAAVFAAKDPEMFALITGYLNMPLTPAMQAKLNMHKSATGEAQEKKKAEETRYERAVAFLAAKAMLARDDWFDSLDKSGRLYDLLVTYVLGKVKKDKAVYVGSNGNYKVFSGVFRNRVTKRNAKGFLVVDVAADDGGDGYQHNIPDNQIIHGDQEEVQAVIALSRRDGVGLFRSVSNYFVDGWAGGDRKKNLIETVGAENLE